MSRRNINDDDYAVRYLFAMLKHLDFDTHRYFLGYFVEVLTARGYRIEPPPQQVVTLGEHHENS